MKTRQRKLKVWNSVNHRWCSIAEMKEFVQFTHKHTEGKTHDLRDNRMILLHPKAYIPVEFTGELDKSDKEIYEGDEITITGMGSQSTIPLLGYVEFDKGAFSLKITMSKLPQIDVGQSIALFDFDEKDRELTGRNIFEHVDVLKGK